MRQLGYEVLDSKKAHLFSSDIEIIRIAQSEGLIILTRDKDFISSVRIAKYRVLTIVFRLKDQKPNNIVEYLKALLENQKEEILIKSLTTVKEESTRIEALIKGAT